MCKTFRQLWLAMLTIGLFSSPALAESAPNPALLNQLALEAPALQKDALKKAVAAMTCAVNSGMEQADRLAIIDFSLPSSEPRLWIFDLRDQTLVAERFRGPWPELRGQLRNPLFQHPGQSPVEHRALPHPGKLLWTARLFPADGRPRAGHQRQGTRTCHRDPLGGIRGSDLDRTAGPHRA
jgi:hypothetical protein